MAYPKNANMNSIMIGPQINKNNLNKTYSMNIKINRLSGIWEF